MNSLTVKKRCGCYFWISQDCKKITEEGRNNAKLVFKNTDFIDNLKTVIGYHKNEMNYNFLDDDSEN